MTDSTTHADLPSGKDSSRTDSSRTGRALGWTIALVGLVGLLIIGWWAVAKSLTSASAGAARDSATRLAEASATKSAQDDTPDAGEVTDTESSKSDLLPPDMRQFLWDVEHIAFETEARVLPRIKQALTQAQPAVLREYLADEFRGSVPGESWHDVSVGPLWSIRRRSNAEEQASLDADAFAQQIADFRSWFDADDAAPCSAKIGLVRYGPIDHQRIDAPWQGLWRVWMRGLHEGRPREIQFSIQVDLDPLVGDVASIKHFIRNASISEIEMRTSERHLLKDVTADSGIDVEPMYDYWKLPSDQFKGSSGGVYAADYDDDGNLDLLIDDSLVGPVLYRGNGDLTFQRANEQAGIPDDLMKPSGACWADLDNDGDVDLIAGSALLSNNGDGTFTEIRATRPYFDLNVALSVADFDGDGLVDIYESHAHSPSINQRMQLGDQPPKHANPSWIDGGWGYDNVLWKNLGNWQFADVTFQTKTSDQGGAAFSSIWLHANDDMAPDLLSINEFGRNYLFLNQGDNTFSNHRLDPVFGGWSMGVVAGDYNNDGYSDVFISNMYSKAGNRVISNVDPERYPADLYQKIYEGTLGNKLYRSRGDGTFETVPHDPVFAEIGWTYGCAFVDYDGDGNLDLYATAGFKSEKKGKPDG